MIVQTLTGALLQSKLLEKLGLLFEHAGIILKLENLPGPAVPSSVISRWPRAGTARVSTY